MQAFVTFNDIATLVQEYIKCWTRYNLAFLDIVVSTRVISYSHSDF